MPNSADRARCRVRLAPGQALQGLAWQTRQVVTAAGPRVRNPAVPARQPPGRRLHAALAVPAVWGEEVPAVLRFASREILGSWR